MKVSRTGLIPEDSSLANKQRINFDDIREAIDPTTGSKYYYNKVTRESYWEDPRITATNSDSNQTQNTANSDLVSRNPSKEKKEITIKNENNNQKYSMNESDMGKIVTKPVTKTSQLSLDPRSLQQPSLSSSLAPNGNNTIKKQNENVNSSNKQPNAELDMKVVMRSLTLLLHRMETKQKQKEIQKNGDNKNNNVEILAKQTKADLINHIRSQKETTNLYQRDRFHEQDSIEEEEDRVEDDNEEENNFDTNQFKNASGLTQQTKQQQQSQQINKPLMPVSAKLNGNKEECQRKSGCTCSACQTGSVAETIELIECDKCYRKFSETALNKHYRLCKGPTTHNAAENAKSAKKVKEETSPKLKKANKWRKQSMELRKALKFSRPESPEPVSNIKSQQVPSKQASSQINQRESVTNTNKRNTIEQKRDIDVDMEESDDGFVECPTCKRRFNDKAAERHIPKVSFSSAFPIMMPRFIL